MVGIAGRNLIIGDKGWFLEGSTGSDEEMYGDLAVPLEMDMKCAASLPSGSSTGMVR